jgi:glutaredoxin/glutathione-dependent peroxiredoxin
LYIGPACSFDESQDLALLLKGVGKAILFAVPGAFTPTCSAQHLPGFVALAPQLKAKGIEDIYCLSVNDRFVMRAWAEATPGCVASGIKLVADGSGQLTAALGLTKDATASRMGIRSLRYAAVIERGVITVLNVDEKGLAQSSAETILSLL